MPTQEYVPSLGKTNSRMALFRYFRPTTDHWRETPCVFFSPSLVHWSTSTITQLIRKGRGNYTHNKSAKIKTFENLIIKMFWQKRKILTPRNFVLIHGSYSNLFLLATCIVGLRVQFVAHVHVQRYMYRLASLARCGYSCASTFHHSNGSVVESWLGARITVSIPSCCWCLSGLLLQDMSEPSLLTRWLLWCVLPLLRLFHFHVLYFLHYTSMPLSATWVMVKSWSKKLATWRSSFSFLSE